MRKRLYQIIERAEKNDVASHVYDLFMIAVIALSMLPLAFKEEATWLSVLDALTACIFVVDYAARWFTADLKLEKGAMSFLLYPVSFMAIVDLLSILPSFMLFSKAFKVLKVVRLLRALRVLKVFRGLRYSKNVEMIATVFKKQKRSLVTVCILAIGYITISALVVFNVEPDTFSTFFDALYWATVSLTTVGYGDIYTVSTVGRIITMLSSILGVAVVALPAGIVTAGYMNELSERDADGEEEE